MSLNDIASMLLLRFLLLCYILSLWHFYSSNTDFSCHSYAREKVHVDFYETGNYSTPTPKIVYSPTIPVVNNVSNSNNVLPTNIKPMKTNKRKPSEKHKKMRKRKTKTPVIVKQQPAPISLVEKKRDDVLISTPLLPKEDGVFFESIYVSDGDRKISDQLAIKRLLAQTSTVDYVKKQRFRFAYEDLEYLDRKNYTYLSLASAIEKYNVNRTILLMLTDYGYLNVFWNSYIASKLDQYPNLLVACLDREVYDVIFLFHY